MELSGRELAAPILEKIKVRVEKLDQKGTIPELAIVTVGGEDTWLSYVSQKQKTAQRLGIKTQLIHLDEDEDKLFQTLKELELNKDIHGIIVQRPLPKHFDDERIVNAIDPVKDIDGFRTDSNHIIPMVLAVENFIKEAYGVLTASDLQKVLINQSICVVGKGGTAGKPIIQWLQSLGVTPTVIDSKTINPEELLKQADLIITGIGKSGVVVREHLNDGAVLIGIGIRKENGKLRGDYDVEDIKSIAKAWTPTPGGVGPLNLAYLFQNLLDAAEKQTA